MEYILDGHKAAPSRSKANGTLGRQQPGILVCAPSSTPKDFREIPRKKERPEHARALGSVRPSRDNLIAATALTPESYNESKCTPEET